MAHEIKYSPKAQRDLKKLPRTVQRRIVDAIAGLAGDSRPSGVKKISGSHDIWRIRIGDYRVVYSVKDDVLAVLILRVGHRGGDVYK